MLVFVTGATGFIGSAAVRHLLARGHRVLGLARSDEGAAALQDAGADVLRGTLADLDTLKRGAREAEATLHVGFEHDFTRFAEVCAQDRDAIRALGEALEGTNRPLIVSSGTALAAAGRPATENDSAPNSPETFPRVSEPTAFAFVARGVAAAAMRFAPSVHGLDRAGLVTYLIEIAKAKGVSAYVGDGAQVWSAVEREDAAELCALAIERPEPGARWHAVGEEGVSLKTIAETIGRGLGVPAESIPAEQAVAHFGSFLSHFAGLSLPASSAVTQQKLGWRPRGAGLLADLEKAFARQ